MYTVTLKNIKKSFGSTLVLRDISLEIKAGEFFFLLGPSGCGKTTLLRLLAGFEQADSGMILFDGKDVSRVQPQHRNCSMVFQSYALWPHLSVTENVAFGLENRKTPSGEMARKINEILQLVHLEGYEKRFPNQLSGGQQQRVALARALVINPQLLLLDEPLSNLDARLRAEMRIEILNLHRKTGITTVYVTHDQEEALSMADRIAFLDKGDLIQAGTPRELYTRPAASATARFLGNANLIEGTILEYTGKTALVKTPIGQIRGLATSDIKLEKESTVFCFFRPEKMNLTGDADYTVSGLVTAAMYAGSHEQLYVENSGVTFQAIVPPPAQPTQTGTRVTFGLGVEDVLILDK
jgi:iron(III) transport system ATP-binding protein